MTAAATYTESYSLPRRPFPWRLLLAFAIAITAAAAIAYATMSSPHAIARHGEQAEQVRRCSENSNPNDLLHFYDSVTGFMLEFCPMPGGGYGLSVNRPDGGNITRYVPRWARSKVRIFEKMQGRQCFAVAGVEGCWLPAEKVAIP